MKRKPTVAFLTRNIIDTVGDLIWKGVLKTAKEKDINLLTYYGGQLGKSKGSAIYKLIEQENIDGIISWISSNNADKDLAFFSEIKHIPLVALSQKIPGVSTIYADCYSGMKEVMQHLIKVHNYKKIAIIRGDENHSYLRQRFNAYVDALNENNISIDNRLISQVGIWTREWGWKCARLFIEEENLKPGIDIQAIVCVSDHIALGLLDYLKEKNIDVPETIAFVGFNNIFEANVSSPPITTVSIPFSDQGKIAVETIIKKIEKRETESDIMLPTEMILGQSCGCLSQSVVSSTIDDVEINMNNKKKTGRNLFELTLSDRKEEILAVLAINIEKFGIQKKENKKFLVEQAKRLFNIFLMGLSGNDTGLFISRFNKILDKEAANNRNILIWNDVISLLRKTLNPFLTLGQKNIAENIWQQTRIIICETLKRYMEYNSIQASNNEGILRQIGSELLTSYDIIKLQTVLNKSIPKLYISDCYICVYEPAAKDEYPVNARLIYGFQNGSEVDKEHYNVSFSAKKLLPKDIFRDKDFNNFILTGLSFQDNQIGFVLFKSGLEDGSIYVMLSNFLSSAMNGTFLFDETVRKSEKLNEAYQHLRQNQKQLLAAENMASLGRLAAGIAHEMNTPLASISAAMQELKALVTEYKNSIDHPEVLPEDHRELAREMENNIILSIKAAEKTSSFIRGIKGQSFNLIKNTVEKYNASQIITDTLKLLEFKFKRSHCGLITDIDDSVILFGNPRGLSQIVTNLVNNALEASDGEIITVTVRLKKAEKNVTLIVEDTGPGIPEEILTHIFDPFFTTKPFGESSGLGLGIVKDLVTQFNGTINVNSNNGITRFTIDLPISNKAE